MFFDEPKSDQECGGSTLPRLWFHPPGERIMVLAPHMDDEVLGCGGVLAKYRQLGKSTFVVFCDWEKRRDESRHDESRAAACVLGVEQTFRLPGMRSRCKSMILDACAGLFRELQVDTVYLPHLHDWHPEHLQCSRLFAEFCASESNLTCSVYGYEVWSHPFPSIVCDVTAEFEMKLKALRCYASQLALMNYENLMSGTGRMRSVFFRRSVDFAEAFQDYGSASHFARSANGGE